MEQHGTMESDDADLGVVNIPSANPELSLNIRSACAQHHAPPGMKRRCYIQYIYIDMVVAVNINPGRLADSVSVALVIRRVVLLPVWLTSS